MRSNSFVRSLETEKMLRRANELIAVGNSGSDQHPNNAGPGLAASGAFGIERRKLFLADYPRLVRLAALAVQAGYDDEPPAAGRVAGFDAA